MFDNLNPPYQIIYADPPWNERGAGKIKRGADRHYSLMKIQDIVAMPVQKIADENAHLYLWTTNTHFPEALEVMKAWGFKYKTTITWVKDHFGLGQYYRGQTEHCLFGVRGMIPYKYIKYTRQQGVTFFYAPRKKHSQKPAKMRGLICRVSDREGFNKVELFAREKNPGWDTWGFEANK